MKFSKVYVVPIILILLFITTCSSSTKPIHQMINLSVGGIGPAGGYIFYDKGEYSDGWRYMEVAPANSEFNAEWGAYGHDIAGTQVIIGSGKRNTELIVARFSELGETGMAAQMCRELNINGFSDWFLPSRDELNLMYVNIHLRGIGDFGQGTNDTSWMNWWYWSSSQDYADYAWGQHFASGLQHDDDENLQGRVRAVRFF
jgi:hypothetical protein